jgi:hypothetical protein
MSTNLIDTYVSEVGRRLPRKTRTDIEAEIRSILQDMLDERSQKTGKPVDEEMTLEVLKSYGDPEKVAATYQGERYLIGPRLYPIFMMVLRIVLLVTGILAAIGLGVAAYQTTLTPLNAFETIHQSNCQLWRFHHDCAGQYRAHLCHPGMGALPRRREGGGQRTAERKGVGSAFTLQSIFSKSG